MHKGISHIAAALATLTVCFALIFGSVVVTDQMDKEKRTLNKIAKVEGYDNVETKTGSVHDSSVSKVSARVGECTVTITRQDWFPEPDWFIVNYYASEENLYMETSLTDSYQLVKSQLLRLFHNGKIGCDPTKTATR